MYRPDIPPHIAGVIQHFPPDLKHSIKAAVRTLTVDPHAGVPLIRELEGFWKYRVRRFRIIYRIDQARKVIRVVAVGHRRTIYEEVVEAIRKGE